MEFYSAIKKNEVVFCRQMDEVGKHNVSEVSQVHKGKTCMSSLTCGR
jgi:hypothetical protein